MRVSTGKTALHVLKYALLCGVMTGSSAIFLLFLQSIILFYPTEPLELEFYTDYFCSKPWISALLGTLVGAGLALIIDSTKKLIAYISLSALVIGMIVSLMGLNSLLAEIGL
jgi:hypothetical protein